MTAPKLTMTDSGLAELNTDALVIGTMQGERGIALVPGVEALDKAFDGELTGLLDSLGATGKADEVVKLPTFGKVGTKTVVAVGLGKPAGDGSVSPEQVRRASGAAARALTGVARAASALSCNDLGAAVEGTVLGAYQFTEYKSNQHGSAPVKRVDLLSPTAGTDREHRAKLRAATAIAEAVCVARDLVNTPPNDLYPDSFAARTTRIGADAGLEVEVLDEKALRRDGFGGVLGVGEGSTRGPRLVRLRYAGKQAKARIALVGKGITFDTGGISIKPALNMADMTSDMGGAAAVVATVALAAKLRYPLEVIATVPMAENMPSGTAYRPGDVLRMYGGRTVEVLNTDAEGRLILADAITRACEDKPDYLIETSTLTGAQVVALGKRTAGVMGSEEFRDRVARNGTAVGEATWSMPLPEELRGELDSKLADLANVTGHRWGGMLVAGIFLREFVADSVPWAHIDIAGPSFNTDSPWGYTGKGGTGVPVRTMAAVLADIAENG